MSAELAIHVLNELKDSEERDVDFFLVQWRHCVNPDQERELIKSFRRQMLVVAAHIAVEEPAPV